jgi:branched-chain amino acid transport system permease protein
MDLPCGTFQENYAQDMAIIRTKTQWGILAAFLILLFTFPLFLSDTLLTIVTVIGITVISVHGLNILTGYCGQISMGHAAFMAVGVIPQVFSVPSLAGHSLQPSPVLP